MVDGLGAGFDCGTTDYPQHPDSLDQSVGGFRSGGGFTVESGPPGGLGVGGVGFSQSAAQLTVCTVDLYHLDTDPGEIAGQAGAVAAGAFHPNPHHTTLGSQPAAQFLKAGCIGRERSRSQDSTGGVHYRRDMTIAMGVHPAKHLNQALFF